MPISIAGSGTITGISVGGIPDGVVDTDVLAANAVTTAKLGSAEQSGLCKAWVNFNGTSTVAIRASYNVSSITDNGVGDYTVNFTTALADANYAFSFGAGTGNGRLAMLYNGTFNTTDSSSAKTTGSIRIAYADPTGVLADNAQVAVSIFR
jgi:hypothetical protein